MESLTDEDPRSVGGYELRARLGQGGFGQVYLGLSPYGRAVAVKPKGAVDHLTPAPGQYPRDQQITLYASAGSIAVPDVVGLTDAEAVAVLEDDGFGVRTESVAAASGQVVEAGTVYRQSPAAGRAEPEGTLIEIFVEPQASANASPTPTASIAFLPLSTTSAGGGNGNGGF